jgi:hypothetical protein
MGIKGINAQFFHIIASVLYKFATLLMPFVHCFISVSLSWVEFPGDDENIPQCEQANVWLRINNQQDAIL